MSWLSERRIKKQQEAARRDEQLREAEADAKRAHEKQLSTWLGGGSSNASASLINIFSRDPVEATAMQGLAWSDLFVGEASQQTRVGFAMQAAFVLAFPSIAAAARQVGRSNETLLDLHSFGRVCSAGITYSRVFPGELETSPIFTNARRSELPRRAVLQSTLLSFATGVAYETGYWGHLPSSDARRAIDKVQQLDYQLKTGLQNTGALALHHNEKYRDAFLFGVAMPEAMRISRIAQLPLGHL